MKLKSPKNKGKRGEYLVRDLIRGYGWACRRTPGSGAFEGWKGDITAPDFPFFIEVKNTEKTQFAPWYKKAEDQTIGKPPLIAWVHKGNIYSFLLMSDLLTFMKTGQLKTYEIKKEQKKTKLSLDDTSNLKFSKKQQVRRKAK